MSISERNITLALEAVMMAEMLRYHKSPCGEDSDSEEEKDDSEEDKEDTDYDDNKDDTDFEDLLSQNEDVEVFSLQNLCLKSVTKNFDRFNTAYATSKNFVLRRNLLFLQRAYSDHMITEMKGHINDSCLEFLLNEHLKELHLDMFHNCSEDALLKRLSEIGHGIEIGHLFLVVLSMVEAAPLVKKVVLLLPNVHTLHLNCVCNDEIMQNMAASCPKLQELYIDDSSVTDEGVKSLFKENDGTVQAKCHLKTLSLKNTSVGAPGVAFLLENMPSLQTLTHQLVPTVLYSIHKEDVGNNMQSTAKKYNLSSLDLMNYDHASAIDLSDILTVCARVCPHITKLCTAVMCEHHLDFISLFSKLEDLSLDGIGTGESNLNLNLNEYLRLHGKELKELKLCYFSMSVWVLLEGCPKLKSLNLSDITFQWEARDESSALPTLEHLRKLSLENFVFKERSIEMSVDAIFKCGPKLEVLDMAHCELGESGMQSKLNDYCCNCTLQELHFRCSDVNIILLECILLTCSSLRTLGIYDCVNIHAGNIENLYDIISSKKNKVNIIWSDDDSELNSIDVGFLDNDFFDYDGEYYDDYYDDGDDYESDY